MFSVASCGACQRRVDDEQSDRPSSCLSSARVPVSLHKAAGAKQEHFLTSVLLARETARERLAPKWVNMRFSSVGRLEVVVVVVVVANLVVPKSPI